MQKAKKRGRPKGTVAGRKRDALIQLKAFPEERDSWLEAANRDGLQMSSWIRQQLNRAVREISQ
jgi:hypothetical protein